MRPYATSACGLNLLGVGGWVGVGGCVGGWVGVGGWMGEREGGREGDLIAPVPLFFF